ncbi:MAG: UDP-3-O-acyl-N-acetylglucosamine deacetylase, partial [Vulcanimicrobiaceae bacterium]
MTERQHTLRERLVYEGVGLHTGADCRVALHPQPADSGVSFRLAGGKVVFPALAEYVVETKRATVLGSDGTTVSTVEHLMAALFAMGVDNVAIEVDGPEIPVLEGSSSTYAQAFEATGIVEQPVERRVVRLAEPVAIRDGDAVVVLLPADAWRVRFAVDFPAPVGAQFFDGTIDARLFVDEIAGARTFGYLREVQALLDRGLARGGSLDNALVFDDDGPMTPLRWPNEVVRHKVLDLIGDFSLLGGWPQFEVIAVKSGHKLHARAVAHVRAL